MQPQDSERENAIDDRCTLVLAHTDDGPRLRPLHEHAACIRGTKASLEVHRRAKALNAPLRKIAGENSFEQPLMARACRITCGGCAAFERAYEFKHLRLRVAEPFRGETQTIRTRRYSNDVPHHIALVVPKMQRALAMLRRERVLRAAQIEEDLAVLKHRSLSVFRKEIFQWRQRSVQEIAKRSCPRKGPGAEAWLERITRCAAKALPPLLCAEMRDVRDVMPAVPRVKQRHYIKPLQSALTVIPRSVPLRTVHRVQECGPACVHALEKIERTLDGHLVIRAAQRTRPRYNPESQAASSVSARHRR